MSAPKDGWVSSFSFLLFCASSIPTWGSASLLQELSPQEYFSSLQAGRASLAYFSHNVSPGAQPFLEQIGNSAEALQDYGISVVKVNCPKEDVSRYCGKENALRKAYLFRGNVLIREFPTDALFDVNSIVANVLFALLFNEVKYVETLADLQNIENTLKGRSNMVFAYVPATGTAEHRAVMEVAFVYGTVHQFVLTTEATLLKDTGNDEPDVSSARLLFCHCQQATDLAQPCRRTAMEQALTMLNIHRHLKLMGAPLVTEVAEDPEKVSTVHLQLGLPLVFILSQKETYEADKRTAEFVAWQLLGKAGVALLSRDLVDLNILLRSNVALKTPDEGVPIKYLVLEDTDEVITLVEDKNKVEQIQEDEEEEEDEEEKENNNQDIQDDQVVEAISRDKKRELPLEQILVLTEETFHSTLLDSARTVVLFYASWEAVSLAVLRSYTEVADLLKGTQGVLLSRVNCWDWPGVCTKENVTQFPTIRIYEKGERSVMYNGMWGTEELTSFIMLSRVSCPLKLATIEEAEGYLRGEFPSELSSYHHTSVLGVFSTATSEAREAFKEAGNILSGHVTMGMYFEDDALALSRKYAVSPPALLLARSGGQSVEGITLSKQSAQDMVQMIRYELLEVFPEITVQNLPRYLELRKPFLILFSDGVIGQMESEEMLKLAKGRPWQAFVACWLNLKKTPVGRGVLKTYFATTPSLPVLVWVNLHAGGQVFKFPSEQAIAEMNILSWLEKLKAGLEIPSSTLSEEDWKPPLPAYDFLQMMETAVPELPPHTSHRRGDVPERCPPESPGGDTAVREEPSLETKAEKVGSPGRDLRGTAPRLAAREKQGKRHSEL
ncbi:thioredoxin domain-containing protein 16 isoform X1 [Grus americana]|uniref:thioredoxin domain-containing protein 16 isoform X1 n=1 Tax=Grus americana TaxID=9117 RepID=UPI00240886BA|nr:thioredoxin domain-containing protein 16 isoform X1 [Grus americana]XP_054683653.1 thioredoxin domain-containing protein 16 isoform X1 [Grus americana]XP_054683654.1 thioredoxin domain-containing protein 16 isoform X1 [Grus americana]